MPPTPDDGSGPLDVDAAFAEIVARWGDDARADDADAFTDGTGPADTTTTGGTSDGGASGRHALPGPVDRAGDTDDNRDHNRDHNRDDVRNADSARTVRPARPLPPAPREDVPQAPPGSAWGEPFPVPTGRDSAADDLDPAELAFLEADTFVPDEPKPLPRDLVGWAAWIAVVGAPLFLLVVALGWRDVPQLVTAVTAGVFVVGFATLVVRLPSSRDDDDDDGAVV